MKTLNHPIKSNELINITDHYKIIKDKYETFHSSLNKSNCNPKSVGHPPTKTRIGSVVNHFFMRVRFSPPAFELKIGSKARRTEIDQITERIHSEE